jgi:hypothetical protein
MFWIKGVKQSSYNTCMMITPHEGCIICMEASTSHLIDIKDIVRTCTCNYPVHAECMHDWLEKKDHCLICHKSIVVVGPTEFAVCRTYIIPYWKLYFAFICWLISVVFMVYYGGHIIGKN